MDRLSVVPFDFLEEIRFEMRRRKNCRHESRAFLKIAAP